jgi:glutathione S-transferase
MRLYGGTDSGHSYKIRLFLLLTETEHDYHWIDLQTPRSERPTDFVAASKFGEVPVLVDGGASMCQSNAILQYLAKRTQQLCGKPEEWQTILEWLSWETNRIGFSFPNYRYYLRYAPQPPEVMNFLKQRALLDLQVLDEQLSRQAFLLPSGISIADISCSAYLFWLSQTDIDANEYPHVQRWLAAIKAQPRWTHPDAALANHSNSNAVAR